jgi:hypothetical protein
MGWYDASHVVEKVITSPAEISNSSTWWPSIA